MSDGSRLRQSWYNALNEAESQFQQLLHSSASADWKRVVYGGDVQASKKGKARVAAIPELADVVVHRKTSKSGEDIYRLMLDVPTGDEQVTLEPWRAVLTTPELRQEWDPAVEDAHLLEMFDNTTRISKTNFALGWPANPRDAVTISRSFHDASTVIDISTSLPRSPDEPAYLRPSPPYVRSHVTLFAWCIQYVNPALQTSTSSPSDDVSKKKGNANGRLRVTCFYQHDLKAAWTFGTSQGATQQLATMALGLLKTVIKRGKRVPKLVGYGHGVSIERIRFQIDREALTIDYAIVPEDDEHPTPNPSGQGTSEYQTLREQRRLTRSIECTLPSAEGWDVRVTTKASSDEVENLPWSATATRSSSFPLLPQQSATPLDQIVLRLTHSALIDDHSILKVRAVIELSGGASGLRLNGLPHAIQDFEPRDPSSHRRSTILQDLKSVADLSLHTTSSMGSANTSASTSSSSPTVVRQNSERSAAAEKSVSSRVRRNYIYFSSLLQEPEAKWRRVTEARGVSITQLDSIDPTLVVYRAEATFVGVALWDLYGAVVSPGARVHWDKQHEDGVLLEDVSELTELWHFKSKPAWPVNGRDAVVLKTVYKSPTTIHVFSFSADDPHLFPNVPLVEPNVIRTQVDLQGWAIEALSPTTTLLTLLEQSDPKGWTNKTSIPTQMINNVAGIGEFAIKFGGPPILTRLAGAKANDIRYDHERGSFKVEYEAASTRRASSTSGNNGGSGGGIVDADSSLGGLPAIECEFRCDIDAWAGSLDIVVDPPPQTVSCLRRHRLSAEGGGLWVTLTHDALFVDDDRLLTIVRRAPGKEKGLVMVNGTKMAVDVEELPEHEIKFLAKKKRVKPPRIPLDQPPVMGVIRRRRAEWDADAEGSAQGLEMGSGMLSASPSLSSSSSGNGWASAPRTSSPLVRFWTYAVDQATSTTQQAVAAITPVAGVGGVGGAGVVGPSASKLPMQYALEALAWAQEAHTRPSAEGWSLVSDKGIAIHRKLIPEISPAIPVYKGSKVIEGVSAEELASVITEYECRKKWDDRFDGGSVFESFGDSCRTSFFVSSSGFPFRDRGFYLASIMARAQTPPSLPSSQVGALLSRRNTGATLVTPATTSATTATMSTPTASASASEAVMASVGSTAIGERRTTTVNEGAKNAIFCVSASFSPDSLVGFASNKYNAYVLPIGRVFVDAWILETLDPYTKENYAIPSARCTRLVAVDFAGSIPAALNASINATLPRAILGLETFMKKKGTTTPLPMMRLPPAGFVIADKKAEENMVNMSWKVWRRDEQRLLIHTRYTPDDRVYRTRFLVSLGQKATAAAAAGDVVEQRTPRPSRIAIPTGGVNESGTTTSMIAPDHEPPKSPSSPGSDTTTATTTIITSPHKNSRSQRSAHLSKSPTRRRTTSTSSKGGDNGRDAGTSYNTATWPRSSLSAFTIKGEVRPPTDLVVAEVVIDSKTYPDGYEITLRSRSRSSVGSQPIALIGSDNDDKETKKKTSDGGSGNNTNDNNDNHSGETATTTSGTTTGASTLFLQLPLAYTIHTMPSSPGHSSGLNVESPSRHLLKLTLPTAQYQITTVKDPLTGEIRSAPPKPEWMVELAEGVIVDVEVRPSSAPALAAAAAAGVGGKKQKGDGEVMVMVDGVPVVVVGEKESLTAVGREELLDDRVSKMCVLSRMPNEADPLPDDLRTAIAVAEELLDPGRLDSLTVDGQETLKMVEEGGNGNGGGGGGGANANASGSEETAGTLTQQAVPVPNPHVPHVASGGLLSFWHAYPNPLTRFTSGSPSGAASSSSSITTASAGASSTSGTGTRARHGTQKEERVEKKEGERLPGGLVDINDTNTGEGGGGGLQTRRTAGLYPFSTIMVVAVIAFLIGSLLRSLVTPADFVHVVEELKEGEGGYREIRRLFEVKYLIGGWDLQIAIVRR